MSGGPRGGSFDPGQALRSARESLGLGLAEVRDRTGIRWPHLEALESMDLAVLPDQRTVLTASRRYAEVVGLDATEICTSVLHAWQQAHSYPADATALERELGGRRTRPAVVPRGRGGGAHPSGPPTQVVPAHGRDPQHHLRAFSETAEVPALGGGAGQTQSMQALQFADTGAIPVTRGFNTSARSSPWLRYTVAAAGVLLLLAVAGAAIDHYEPRWFSDIHLIRAPSAHTGTSAPAGTTGSSPSASHQTSQGTRANGNSVVTTSSSAPGTEGVTVKARSYTVLVTAQQPCWIDATAGSSSTPLYEGVLEAGQSKVLVPGQGQLSIDFGASYVKAQVQVSGKPVSGWSFSPSVVPFKLDFASA